MNVGCCLPKLRNNIPVPLSRDNQSKIKGMQRINPLFHWGWLLLLGDGKWPVRLLERVVVTGIWRESNNRGNVCVMKYLGAFA